MERFPQKPKLEYQEHVDSNGILVQELTPESERQWSEYLRLEHLARVAMASKEKVDNNE